MDYFNSKAVANITGLSYRQIDYWDRSHLIKPSASEATGRGSSRLYLFSDLVQLKVAKTLIDKGISVQKIRKALGYLKKHMPEVEKPLAELKFLTDGDTIFIYASTKDKKGEKVIMDTLRSGQLVFSIALGEIIEKIKGKVAAFQQEKKYKVTVKGRSYSVTLHPDTEDGGYWVECPALPGCSSQGDTIEEALTMIKDAIEGHLEVTGKTRKKKKAS
jgi:predicted RNase H-like HicB family nuclease